MLRIQGGDIVRSGGVLLLQEGYIGAFWWSQHAGQEVPVETTVP